MIKIIPDFYYFRDAHTPKLYINIDWFTFEDSWKSMYRFGKPIYDKEQMKLYKKLNANRYRWFRISMDVLGYILNIDIRLNKIGPLYYGRYTRDWALSNIADNYEVDWIRKVKDESTWFAAVTENDKMVRLISYDDGNTWNIREGQSE